MSAENPILINHSEAKTSNSNKIKRLGAGASLFAGTVLTTTACTPAGIQNFEAQTGIDFSSAIEQKLVNFQLPKMTDPIIVEPTHSPEPKDLKKLIEAKKHPKGNLIEIQEELFSYLQENPEIDQKVRALNPERNPEKNFDDCLLADHQDSFRLSGCTSTLKFLFELYTISKNDEVYEMTDKFMGATKNSISIIFQSIFEYVEKDQKEHPELYD